MIGWIILGVLGAPLVVLMAGIILFFWFMAVALVVGCAYMLLGKDPPNWVEDLLS